MSYLLIVVIGTVAGWIGGQYIKGNEEGVAIDLLCGAIGAVVAVAIARMMSDAASGWMVSVVVAVIGSIGSLYAMRRVMKARLVPETRPRRRR